MRPILGPSIAAIFLQRARHPRMRLFADRFLVDHESAFDLASGARVRLTIDKAIVRTLVRDREALCSDLAGIRHPLLLPIVDFGLAEGSWFEAHAAIAPLRSARQDASGVALHLVRFMGACGIRLSAETAARHVTPG